MNKTTRILLIVLAIIVILGVVFWALFALKSSRGNNTQSSATTTGSTNFPIGGTNTNSGSTGAPTGSSMTVEPINGGTPIETKDFLKAPGVIANADNNQGYYILVGSSNPSTVQTQPYEMDYSAKDQSFGIVIYKEPLGQYRQQAEQQLMGMLGISEADMCNLNYVLSVGQGVNDNYAGQNLGFSFCPGAVPLPQ